MNTGLVLFAVRSIVRLGLVTREAAAQHARNRTILLPGLDPQRRDRLVVVNGFFNNHPDHRAHVAPGGPLAEFWDNTRARTDRNAVDSLYVAALQISAAEGVDIAAAMTSTGAVLLDQFDPGQEPLSPLARIALTAADIAIEFLAVNPRLVTDDPNGQQLIGAFATSLADYLPNDGEFGPREKFAERLAAGFLRAGLATANAHPAWVVDERQVGELLQQSLAPIVARFPETIAERIRWNDVLEGIVGPAASAALEAIAAQPAQYLGARFDPSDAFGPVTQALLLQAAEDGLRNPFSRERLLGIHRALLGVAARRPELFVVGNAPQQELARDALRAFAGILAASPPPFDRATGLALAQAAIEAVGANATLLADPDKDWHGIAVQAFAAITGNLSAAFASNAGLAGILTRAHLVDIGRVVLAEVAANPALVVRKRDPWQGVIAAIGAAMAADRDLLLSGDDWRAIAAVAAAEAAANPARLFEPGGSPGDVLATRLMSALLHGASAALTLPDGRARSVLVGQALREAIVIALQAAAGRARGVLEHLALIEALVAELNTLAVTHPLDIGSREWLQLFELLLTPVLEGTPAGEISPALAMELLHGG
jgi:hypothetical protein